MRALFFPALLWPASVAADTLDETHFSRNFCWERAYSAAHLAEHPEQTVAAIRLTREPMGFPKAPGETLMTVAVTFRGDDGGRTGEESTGISYCRPDGEARLRCGLEGDAGNFSIEAPGSGEVLLTTGDRGMSFETRDAIRELRPDQGDDRAFLLRRCG